jgi:hypothetical protein
MLGQQTKTPGNRSRAIEAVNFDARRSIQQPQESFVVLTLQVSSLYATCRAT